MFENIQRMFKQKKKNLLKLLQKTICFVKDLDRAVDFFCFTTQKKILEGLQFWKIQPKPDSTLCT